MEYNKIISVTGLGGLFELVGSKADGAIVRALEDGTTKFISSRSHQFSHLESIEIFTEGDNVNLTEVLNVIKNSKESLPDYKDVAAVKKYFEKVYPAMDFERVYASDMKKMVRWYSILEKNNVDFTPIPEAVAEEITEPLVEETISATKTKSAKKTVSNSAETTEEKPKKKAAPKKKKTEE